MSRTRFLSLTLWVSSLAITLLLFWFSSTFGLFSYEPDPHPPYHASLADAFLNGQLHLLEPPRPEVLGAENPYDPYQRGYAGGYIWDASLYQGKYFLYFGAVPTLLFYLPSKVLLGFYPTDNLVIAVLSFATIAVLFAICRRVADRLLHTKPFGHPALWFLYIAFASSLSLQLAGAVWVVAAVSGMFFQSLALLCLLLTISPDETEGNSTRWGWAALSGCAVIAAVGCRPTHLAFVPVGALVIVGAGLLVAGRSKAYKSLTAFLVPVAIGSAILGWYNHARFGSVFEFGQRYQLGVTDFLNTQLCSLERAIQNPVLVAMQSWYLVLQPIHLTAEYPFIDFSRISPKDLAWGDPQYVGADSITGLLFFSPLIIPGLFAAAIVTWRAPRVTKLYILGCLALAAFMLAYLHTCVFAAARFLFEIVSVLLITTIPALWRVCSSNSSSPFGIARRITWRVIVSAGLVAGICIGIAGSLGGHFFKADNTLPFFQQLVGMPEPAAPDLPPQSLPSEDNEV